MKTNIQRWPKVSTYVMRTCKIDFWHLNLSRNKIKMLKLNRKKKNKKKIKFKQKKNASKYPTP